MARYEQDFGAYGSGAGHGGYGPDFDASRQGWGSRVAGWRPHHTFPRARPGNRSGFQGRSDYGHDYAREFGTPGDLQTGVGGGRAYGRRPRSGREWSRPEFGSWDVDRSGRFESRPAPYGADFREADRPSRAHRSPRGFEGYGAEFERPMRGAPHRQHRSSYGPRYGERWESIQAEDLARRNFEGR